MTANSAIEWTDHTFNPWIGCTKVSPACDRCYAERSIPARFQAVAWGPHEPRRRTSAANWALPKRWNAQHQAFFNQHGRRQRVFCASLADVFDNAVDLEWRRDLFALIAATPNLDWLLLTKRVGNVMAMTNAAGGWPANAWLGITVCNQPEADRDVMRALRVKAALKIGVLFLSVEPLLEALQLWKLKAFDFEESPSEGAEVYPLRGLYAVPDCDWLGPKVDWVIVGGESGPGSRPMHPDWARSLRDQCQAAGVPFFFKQWGEWGYTDQGSRTGKARPIVGNAHIWPEADLVAWRIGKEAAGRMLDGRTWDEVPT